MWLLWLALCMASSEAESSPSSSVSTNIGRPYTKRTTSSLSTVITAGVLFQFHHLTHNNLHRKREDKVINTEHSFLIRLISNLSHF